MGRFGPGATDTGKTVGLILSGKLTQALGGQTFAWFRSFFQAMATSGMGVGSPAGPS